MELAECRVENPYFTNPMRRLKSNRGPSFRALSKSSVANFHPAQVAREFTSYQILPHHENRSVMSAVVGYKCTTKRGALRGMGFTTYIWLGRSDLQRHVCSFHSQTSIEATSSLTKYGTSLGNFILRIINLRALSQWR